MKNESQEREGMRLAYLASMYPAASHTFILREIEALRAQGATVFTAAIRPPDDLDRMGEVERLEAQNTYCIQQTPWRTIGITHARAFFSHPLDYLQRLGYAMRLRVSLGKRLGYFVEAILLLAWMRRQNLRHVHVHFANPGATVALVATHGVPESFSLSIHGPDIFDDVGANLLCEKVTAAKFVRCISFFCRSQLMRLIEPQLWYKLHIVRCGVDVSQFTSETTTSSDTSHLVCVGRLIPTKGQWGLLEVCNRLHASGQPFTMTFIGTGPDEASLKQRVRELNLDGVVTFTGALSQSRVRDVLGTADVFVLPTFAEGLPIVLMEAMASGVPCVTSSLAGIPELISDGVNGLLTPPSDWDGLYNAISKLLADPELRASIGRNGRHMIETLYDNERNVERLVELFTSYDIGSPR